MPLPTSKVLRILADNLERRKGVIPLSQKKATAWSEGLDIPRAGETVIYTGQMYQLIPSINSMTNWMAKFEDYKLTSLFDAGRTLNRAVDLSWFMALGSWREQKTYNSLLRNIANLLKRAGVEFGYLYEKELYSGALLFDEGVDEIFTQQAYRVYKTLKNNGVKRVITIDPHTTNMLRSIYPKIISGYDIEVKNYLELLAESNSSPVKPLNIDIVIHDPCVYARFESIIDEPRHLLKNAGVSIREPELSGKLTYCCGGPLESLFPGKAHSIAEIRIEQLESCCNRIVTMCPICLAILKRAAGEELEIKDISEYLIQAYGA
ncbi:MAG: (Fe-S)-binding protein [Dehalococcoidales bacterium]|nr:(Fe-S)-binding protein [Dehalococcoidales bacterium]